MIFNLVVTVCKQIIKVKEEENLTLDYLSPSNLMLTDDGNVYIASQHEVGKYLYLNEENAFSSPEKQQKAYNILHEKSVVWSLGCILLFMITKNEPNYEDLCPPISFWSAGNNKFVQRFPKVSALYDRKL